MTPITVYKCDHDGNEVLRYSGTVIARGEHFVCLRAVFQHGDVDAGVVTLHTGDIFTEWFFSDRWYNIFQIEAADDGHLRGWYCNITRPALVTEETVRADDLALDLFVSPAGEMTVLDDEEFAELPLTADERGAARRALAELRGAVAARAAPFDQIVDGAAG